MTARASDSGYPEVPTPEQARWAFWGYGWLDAQRKRLDSGEPMLTFEVDGSRLEFALEYVLEEMVKYMHVRASGEDVTALLGLTR